MPRRVSPDTPAQADRTPARRKGLEAEVINLPGGQAALFDDPQELLRLSDVDLAELTHRFGKAAGGAMRQLRRAFGLLAWAHWHRLDEAAYGQWLDDFAQVAGVESARTIRRWRDAVVTTDRLAVPAVVTLRRGERAAADGAGKTAGQRGGQDKMSAEPPPGGPTAASAANLPMGGPEPLPLAPPPAAPRPVPVGGPPPAVPPTATPAVEEVRSMVGRITTTDAEVLARCCTAEALRQAHLRIQDARTILEKRAQATARADCAHANLKKLGWGTVCTDCGVKVR